MALHYLVQQGEYAIDSEREHLAFDFGGINGGVARFMSKGDAIAYALTLKNRQPQFAVRVLHTGKRNSPEVFRSSCPLPCVA